MEDEQTSSGELPSLVISGGTVYVCATGDGLDSNGNLLISGGEVTVDGPSGSSNGALDSGSENGGTCLVTGGTVLAIGASGMAEGFGSESTQCSVSLSGSFQAGQTLTLTDDAGNVLFTHTAAHSGDSTVFSSAALTEGMTVHLLINGTESATGTAAYGCEGSSWGSWGWDSWGW